MVFVAHVPDRREPAIRNGTILLGLVYLAFFLVDLRVFAIKTAVLPLSLSYGLLVRQRVAFVQDWLPLLGATILFDAIRGAIWTAIAAGYHVYYVDYVVALEQAVFGTPAAPLPLQAWRHPGLDVAAIVLHASHFAFFLPFGIVLWHTRRDQFFTYRRALVIAMGIGLVGYALIPTAPPWMAALPDIRAIPPVAHISDRIYTQYVQALHASFATNPVAAMPSLHVAFPAVGALVGWWAYGRWTGLALCLYALMVIGAVVYLGEHYAVDVLAGVGVALLAVHVARRIAGPTLSFRAAVILSALAVALTIAAAILSALFPAATRT